MTTEEMMDRQFVPDTIEVPVEWLKKLIELVETDAMDITVSLDLLTHIDLIREKLK